MTNDPIRVRVAEDFSRTPGARFRVEGPHSAEEFLEVLLYPAFERARTEDRSIIIDLDRVEGYATSFLQGTFGNLADRYGSSEVLRRVKVISTEDPYLLDYVSRYIQEAHAVTAA